LHQPHACTATATNFHLIYPCFGAAVQLLVAARSEAEGFKSERDELAEVVLEMQEEIEALKAEREESRT
jgi:hypothetical protein